MTLRLGTREGDPSLSLQLGMKTCTMGKAGDNPGMSSGSNSRHPRNKHIFFPCFESRALPVTSATGLF